MVNCSIFIEAGYLKNKKTDADSKMPYFCDKNVVWAIKSNFSLVYLMGVYFIIKISKKIQKQCKITKFVYFKFVHLRSVLV